VEQW